MTIRIDQEAPPPRTATRPGLLGLGGVLLGVLLTTYGLSWDVQWHIDVGPDTFFTAPHLMLYSGSGIAGLASLAMVLWSTALQRRGSALPRTVGGTPVRVFGGAFTAPVGFLVSGVGAASFLLYGLIDLWWHTVYGFDAVLNSPPHVALFLSISVTMTGAVITSAAARATWWGKTGFVIAAAALIAFVPVAANALSGLPLPIDATILTGALVAGLLLVVAAVLWERPGTVLLIAVALGVLQASTWVFAPWAAHAYAAAIGLPLRDGLTPQPPKLPSAIPMFLIVAATAVELIWAAHRRHRIGTRTSYLLAGGVTGTVTALSLPVQLTLLDPTQAFPPIALALVGVAGLVFGLAGGFLGSRIAVLLISTDRPGQPAPAVSAVEVLA